MTAIGRRPSGPRIRVPTEAVTGTAAEGATSASKPAQRARSKALDAAPRDPKVTSAPSASTAAETALSSALRLANQEQGRDLISVRTAPGSSPVLPGEEVSGRLRREVKDGRPLVRVDTFDGREIRLSPKDVEGVADGGRIALFADKRGNLTIDAAGTEAVTSFLGVVQREGSRLFAVSEDPRAALGKIPLESKDAKLVGKTVLAHVVDGLSRKRSGLVQEVIPDSQPWKKTFTGIAVSNGVEATFSPEVMKDIARIKASFDPEKIEGYEDLTDKAFFAIDNPYSKDRDQAMAIEPTPGKEGSFDVYYAISDLDYFLQLAGEDSALAERARRVQTTTYLPGFDFPVLPRELSEDLCSINAGEKRPAVVMKYTVDDKGEASGFSLIDGIVKSIKDGNYPEAQAHIDGDKVSDPVYAQGIERLKTLGERLIARAEERGMMTASPGERWAEIDESSGELKVEKRGSLWIERANAQISITANQQIGKFLIENGAPAFHRVHEEPEPRKVERARTLVRKLNVGWNRGESARDVMARVETESPLGRAVRQLLLRGMPRAHVSALPGTHHGLQLAEYVQSTAPMRRTRDGHNHAWARDVRDGRTPDDTRLHELVDNSQVAEDRSRKVDREVRTRISAHTLSQSQGKTMEAAVIGVTPFGLELHFSDLDVQHTFPLHSLPGGPWDITDGGIALKSKGGRRKLSLGELVEAKITSTDAHAGKATVELGATKQASPVERKEQAKGRQRLDLASLRGDGFESPHVGEKVATSGIVTAVNAVGFYIQPPGTEGDAAGGILVRTRRDADVQPGQLVEVKGRVFERRPRDGNTAERTIVELNDAKYSVTGFDPSQLPKVQTIGAAGKMVPADRKEAIDFWRSLLGQRVEIGPMTAVAASNQFGDLATVPNGWTPERATRTSEGGLIMPDGEWNHQSVGLKFRPHIGTHPEVRVGAQIPGATGIVTYRSGSFQIELDAMPEVSNPEPRPPHVTKLVAEPGKVTIGGVNALNMHPGEIERAEELGKRIVHNLKSPDIIALQEIQDNDGPENSGTTDADLTYAMIIEEIQKAGGPTYAWKDIPPENNKDGGQPGGNIRNGFLYLPERVTLKEDSVERIGEGNAAFDDSRKSLVAVFEHEGKELAIVNNHFASRHGSTPWTSGEDELIVGGEAKREGQAQAVRAYLDQSLAANPGREAVIIGDFNDHSASPTVGALTAGDYYDLTLEVPADRRFDYNFRGTLGVLQPVLTSPRLNGKAEIEMMHEAVFEGVKSSDHDPVMVRVDLRG